MPWVALVFVLLATCADLRSREIPNAIPLGLFACAVAAMAFGSRGPGWGAALGGLAIAAGPGVILFALGGLGGGDVKMLAALGAALGSPAILTFLFWTALAGALLSIVALARGRRDLAYMPAIALGLLVSLLSGEAPNHATAP